MNTRKLLIAILLTSLFAIPLGSVEPVRASEGIAVVDQANVASHSNYYSVFTFGPIGQSFTPTLPGLDIVELWTNDFSWFNGYGVELYLIVHESTISGHILGTSDIVPLPDNFSGVTRFTFPSLVSLSPGKLYVIEVVAVDDEVWFGFRNWGIGSAGASTYPTGTWIANGSEDPNNDLWFQEGLAKSTPQSPAYCKRGLWAYLTRADGSSFKNQGECLRFVNTGN